MAHICVKLGAVLAGTMLAATPALAGSTSWLTALSPTPKTAFSTDHFLSANFASVVNSHSLADIQASAGVSDVLTWGMAGAVRRAHSTSVSFGDFQIGAQALRLKGANSIGNISTIGRSTLVASLSAAWTGDHDTLAFDVASSRDRRRDASAALGGARSLDTEKLAEVSWIHNDKWRLSMGWQETRLRLAGMMTGSSALRGTPSQHDTGFVARLMSAPMASGLGHDSRFGLVAGYMKRSMTVGEPFERDRARFARAMFVWQAAL